MKKQKDNRENSKYKILKITVTLKLLRVGATLNIIIFYSIQHLMQPHFPSAPRLDQLHEATSRCVHTTSAH